MEEDILLRRVLCHGDATPAPYCSDLVISLHNLALYLTRLQHHDEARDAVEEAVKLRQIFHKADPDTYCRDFANSLHNLSFYLKKPGLYSKARRTIREATPLYRTPYGTARVHYANLVNALHTFGFYIIELGQRSEASRQRARPCHSFIKPMIFSLSHA